MNTMSQGRKSSYKTRNTNTRRNPTAANILPHQQMFLPTASNDIVQQSPAHAMPTPTTNWSVESMPWKITKTDQSGNVMEFTASSLDKDNTIRRALLHQKRKSNLNAPPPMPIKQFISEEKITAHFNGLHISSDYIPHNTDDSSSTDGPSTSGKCFSNLTYEDYQLTAKELEKKLRNANRITLCDELKKIHEQQNKVPYLPEALLNRIDKPCTALVLWQPPPPIINIFKQNFQISSTSNTNTIEDYIPDVDLPTERGDDDIDDFIDNNNTCNLDFNNMKPDSMDEDM